MYVYMAIYIYKYIYRYIYKYICSIGPVWALCEIASGLESGSLCVDPLRIQDALEMSALGS